MIDEKPYLSLLQRYKEGEPYEYIFNKAYFYGEEFFIKSGVLIPRFDTQILLDLCLEEIKKNSFTQILEIGFGSGILSIMLAKLAKVRIKAIDINPIALDVAMQNAKAHGVLHMIDFKLASFEELACKYDFIISNPPYISNNYKLDKYVQSEPKSALFGGECGHELLEKIIHFAKSSKVLACEIGYDQKKILSTILEKEGFDFSFYKDLSGYDRAFVARKRRA